MELNHYLNTAILAAKKAAEIHLHYFQKKMDIFFKTTHFDRVTKADIEAEEAIITVIKGKFPDHNILAEEKEYKQTDSPFVWIIDPLDGTNNFAHGLPVFSVSIAMAKDNILLMGVVYDPTRDELFCAKKGEGAALNSKPIGVSNAQNLSESILGTGFYYNRGKEMENNLENINKFFKNGIIGIRRMGSAALDLCYVACGRLDGFWEHYLSTWDFAAGIFIVEEAGGKVTDHQGKKVKIEPSYIVSSNGVIHNRMLKIVGD